MNKIIISFVLLLILTACTNKQLPTKKSHYNGLYNAVTMDYAKHNKNLENNLSEEKRKNIELNKNKIQLESNIDSAKNELSHRKESLNNDKKNIGEIQNELEKMDILIKTEPLLKKVDKKIIEMHKRIK